MTWLVKIKTGKRAGQIGRVVAQRSRSPLYQIEFPGDPGHTFFSEEEFERVGTMPCPECVLEGKTSELSEPCYTEEGWAQDCKIHGRLFLWGVGKEENTAINLISSI